MGARARQAVRKAEAELTKKDQLAARPVPASKRPIRVKLRRVNCDYHVAYAPESMKRDWWARLKKALGTASPDFVAATLRQIEIASRLPYQGTSEVAVNAVLAIIEGAQPRNEIGCCRRSASLRPCRRHACPELAAAGSRLRAAAARVGLCGHPAYQGYCRADGAAEKIKRRAVAIRAGRACSYQRRRPGGDWQRPGERCPALARISENV